MPNSINLTLNPHLNKTLRFFFLSFLGLFILGIYLIHPATVITNRWDTAAIVATHLFTLFFLLPVFFGSITQLLPVLFGIENVFLKTFDKILIILPLSASVFLYYFKNSEIYQNSALVVFLSLLWLSLIRFAALIIKQARIKYDELKKSMYLHLIIALLYFILGTALSIWLVLVHFGFSLPWFRPVITDLHLTLFLLGFFYHLFIAISQHIIPMFFITNQVPENIITRQLKMPLLIVLSLFSYPFHLINLGFKIAIFYLITEYIIQLFLRLHKRRRSNEATISLWYLFFLCTVISLVLWLLNSFFSQSLEKIELYIGSMIFLGVFFNLILAMILKIIPFLIWQSLTHKQMEMMNFETNLPALNDFILSTNIKKVSQLSCVLLIAILTQNYQFMGAVLIIFSLFLCYLTINALKIQQNTMSQINDHHSTLQT